LRADDMDDIVVMTTFTGYLCWCSACWVI